MSCKNIMRVNFGEILGWGALYHSIRQKVFGWVQEGKGIISQCDTMEESRGVASW